MSGSCTSSNPPPLIFTSWPVATSACLQQIGRQTWWRGGRGRRTEKLAHLWRRGNSRGPARSVCTDFELLCMSMKVGSGLQKKFSGPRDGFWCLQEKKKRKKKKRAQNNVAGREAFVSMEVSWSLRCSGSLLTHLILLSIDLGCLAYSLNSWLGWFIAMPARFKGSVSLMIKLDFEYHCDI